MNIFALDSCPIKAAQYQCDKHVVKMVLETAQLLSTAHHVHQSPHRESVYAMTHHNHPSAVWARQSNANYAWLLRHFVALLREYTRRYGKNHACTRLVVPLANNPCPTGPLTPVSPAMPDHIKPVELTWDSCVDAYRRYYREHKADLLSYKWPSTRPEWL